MLNDSKKTSVPAPLLTIGIDVGDRKSHACVVDGSRKVLEEFSFATDEEGLVKLRRERCAVILEVGPHSRWLQHRLKDLGHEVRVVDPRKIKLISQGRTKTDKRDARTLAQLGAGVPEILGDVKHRSEAAQADLTLLRSRNHLVETRTATINSVRGTLKAAGVKVPKMSTTTFHARVAALVPERLRLGVEPLLALLAQLHVQLRELDKKIGTVAGRYPAVAGLTKITGVGELTALAFVLTLDDPVRFKKSRDVGAYIGLTPRKYASGESDPQLSITRCGDVYLRWILVQAAHYVLGPFAPDCLLRRHGLAILARGGKCAKKRAIVAVARKLAVLMHALWKSGAVYDPWHKTTPPTQAESLPRRKPRKPVKAELVST